MTVLANLLWQPEASAKAAARRVRSLLAAAVVSAAGVTSALAGPVNYYNPFADYGTIVNNLCGFGICGAAEAENSFIFLSNYYKKAYAGTKVTTGNATGATPQSLAALEFGVSGWTAGVTNYAGYYARSGNVNGDYTNTLTDWFNSFAAGTSTINSFTTGTSGVKLLDDFLGPQMQKHEDVELFIYLPDMSSGHVITLTGITYDPSNPGGCGLRPTCTITYQDPNFPGSKQTADVTVNSAGYLQFFDKSTFKGNVIITAAFAESPKSSVLAEPATMTLLGGGAALLGVLRRRRSLDA